MAENVKNFLRKKRGNLIERAEQTRWYRKGRSDEVDLKRGFVAPLLGLKIR